MDSMVGSSGYIVGSSSDGVKQTTMTCEIIASPLSKKHFYILHLLEYCEGPSNSISSQENYCGLASTQGR